MSGFIQKSACRGYRPNHLTALRRYQRPNLLARLLKERKVARFVVAPYGYGKTSILLEYADVVFAFEHVFWINGKSPCFLRDLDRGAIASSCFECDGEAALVIIDDMPSLDATRSERLSQEIDCLLEKSCEVLLACEPSCDTFGALQRDRIRLEARDLLLDDEEIDYERTPVDCVQRPSDQFPVTQRIPMLVWDKGQDARVDFLVTTLREDVPADVFLTMISSIVLKEGTFADLIRIGPFGEAFANQLAREYPHLGFNEEYETFSTPEFRIEDVATAVKRRFERAVIRSNCADKDELVVLWANMLLGYGRGERACETIQFFCSRNERGVWVGEHAVELVRQACFYPCLKIVEDVRDQKPFAKMRLRALECLCRKRLGDDDEAFRLAKRSAFDPSVPPDARTLFLLVIIEGITGAPREQARVELEHVASRGGADVNDEFPWLALARARSIDQDPSRLLDYWEELNAHDASDMAQCVIAAWVYEAFESNRDIDDTLWTIEVPRMRRLERFVRSQVVDCDSEPLDYFAASAGLAMEHAHSNGLAQDAGPLPTAAMLALRRVELSMLDQRRRYERDSMLRAARSREWAITHPDMLLSASNALSGTPEQSVPTLTLRFFGGFDVSIGGVPVDRARFKRQNVRALLVLLAVNQGRELSRQAVCSAMWPKSEPEVARKNFYTIWSQLKRALSLPDGTCPYLIRHQLSCNLEQRYVKSDVMRLNEICRELFFGKPDHNVWAELYGEIDQDFASDLMPSENQNSLIIEAREACRTRLIDALVAATGSITQYGEPQQGIWFARAALEHDDTREDAYAALMRAQIACGQRTAAISTYLACQRVLSEKLGVDPSPETVALYESLIGVEDEKRRRPGAA